MAEKDTKNSELLSDTDPLLTPKGAAEDLRKCGCRISASWFEKLSARGEGPPIDGWWGRTPMRKRSTVRAWAERRMQARQPSSKTLARLEAQHAP